MKSDEILEGNKLIAEFMGWPKLPKKDDILLYNRALCQSNNYLTVSKVENNMIYFKEDTGYECYSIEYWDGTVFRPKLYKSCLPAPSKPYHSSWDWLMPVVEKIEDTHANKDLHYGHRFKIDNWEIVVQDCLSGKIRCSVSPASVRISSKIDAVYQAVIEFIKWYNENK